ncbi:MAG: DNA polymerase III subunit beta, partial [Candidatus Gracilibacteria bacterium]|nr:DNA polymerase III subunit beta [Candidatus Gracilibacteria bacterium]
NYSNIVFTSNNLEMAIEHIVVDNVKIITEGAFCVPSKIFSNYVNLIEDDEINIELLNDNSIEIKTSSSDIKIKGNPASDFPLIPIVKENLSFNLKSEILKKSIEKTLFSSANGSIRPTLAGIYVHISTNLAKFATTDSFRLSEFKVDLDENIKEDFSAIIPNKTAFELKSILQDKILVKVIPADNQIVFSFGNTKFYSRLMNGKFPEYEGFFPSSYNTKAIINKFDLIGALRKINLLSKEANYSVKMSISNETGILIETSQTQSGEARINLVGSVEGEDAIVGLNSEFLLEALGVIDSTHISISFESPLSPILIIGISEDKKDGFKHIIMPLKI